MVFYQKFKSDSPGRGCVITKKLFLHACGNEPDQTGVSPIESKNTIEFTTVAAEYCSYLRKAELRSKKQFLSVVQKVLPLLYLKGALIPDFPFESEESPRKFVTEADYGFILDQVSRNMGELDLYIDIQEPYQSGVFDGTKTSLAECLTDIYQELSDYIQLFRLGEKREMEEALWECRLSFEQYWGPRVISALSAIHTILYGKEAPSEEPKP